MSAPGKSLHGERFATLEPALGNLRGDEGSGRLTLTGRVLFNAQRTLVCLFHNREKLVHHAIAHRRCEKEPPTAVLGTRLPREP